MLIIPGLLLFLLSCAIPGGEADSGAPGGGDTSDSSEETGDSGEETGQNGGACAAVDPGDDWAWTGECPQMRTPVVITVSGCTLTLDYDAVGGMTMGTPYSATIVSDTVTFANDNGVDGCVGTVKDSSRITGACDNGCTYTLRR